MSRELLFSITRKNIEPEVEKDLSNASVCYIFLIGGKYGLD